jgi:hypothetical protein
LCMHKILATEKKTINCEKHHRRPPRVFIVPLYV